MLASFCQADHDFKPQDGASQATPFRVLGLLGEHFALQDDAPDVQNTKNMGKDAAVHQALLDVPRGALTCLNSLEHFDQNDKITDGGRSQFPVLAPGFTFDQSPCCAELGGRSPDDYLSSKASPVPVGDALGFRPPKLPPSRIACSPNTSPFWGMLAFSPDRFPCGDCLIRFSPVPDLSSVPTPRSCWDTGASTLQQPVQPGGAGAFDNAVLRCPCLDMAPESGLHTWVSGAKYILGEPVHCKQRP